MEAIIFSYESNIFSSIIINEEIRAEYPIEGIRVIKIKPLLSLYILIIVSSVNKKPLIEKCIEKDNKNKDILREKTLKYLEGMTVKNNKCFLFNNDQ